MLTSKYFKVKFQFSEFISGLEKGMSPTGKQVSQIHMPIETTHSRFRQSTKGKNIWSSFFSELKSPIFQNHNFSSVSSQVSFKLPLQCLARWNRTESLGTGEYPSLVWKTVQDTFRWPLPRWILNSSVCSRRSVKSIFKVAKAITNCGFLRPRLTYKLQNLVHAL